MSNAGSPNSGGSGLGQAASDLLKEMQKAQADLSQLEKTQTATPPTEAFGQVLQSQQASAGAQAQAANGSPNVADVLREAKTQQAAPSTRVGATEKSEETRLESMITGLVRGQDKMSHIMTEALSGKSFSPSELLAMQVGVYRFSQELDLTSKVVQQATAGIKQTLNTQV